MDEDFADELELSKLIVKKKKAELDEAIAQKEVATSSSHATTVSTTDNPEWSQRKMWLERRPKSVLPTHTSA